MSTSTTTAKVHPSGDDTPTSDASTPVRRTNTGGSPEPQIGGDFISRDQRLDKILTRQKRLVFVLQVLNFSIMLLAIMAFATFVIILALRLHTALNSDVKIAALSKEIRVSECMFIECYSQLEG